MYQGCSINTLLIFIQNFIGLVVSYVHQIQTRLELIKILDLYRVSIESEFIASASGPGRWHGEGSFKLSAFNVVQK